GTRVAAEIGAREYLECSALTGEGVREVFESATRASLLIHGKLSSHRRHCIII
ncbi:Rho GTPase, partial [Podila epigama]